MRVRVGPRRHGLPPTSNRVADGGRCAMDRCTTEGRGPQQTAAIVRLAGVTRTWLRGGRFPMTSHPVLKSRSTQVRRTATVSCLVETRQARAICESNSVPRSATPLIKPPIPRRAVRKPGRTTPGGLSPHGKTAAAPYSKFRPLHSTLSFLLSRPQAAHQLAGGGAPRANDSRRRLRLAPPDTDAPGHQVLPNRLPQSKPSDIVPRFDTGAGP